MGAFMPIFKKKPETKLSVHKVTPGFPYDSVFIQDIYS